MVVNGKKLSLKEINSVDICMRLFLLHNTKRRYLEKCTMEVNRKPMLCAKYLMGWHFLCTFNARTIQSLQMRKDKPMSLCFTGCCTSKQRSLQMYYFKAITNPSKQLLPMNVPRNISSSVPTQPLKSQIKNLLKHLLFMSSITKWILHKSRPQT